MYTSITKMSYICNEQTNKYYKRISRVKSLIKLTIKCYFYICNIYVLNYESNKYNDVLKLIN